MEGLRSTDGQRLVIDTNQAREIELHSAPADCHPILVITPLTWAEILNGPRDAALRRVRAIAQYDVRFGMDLSRIYDRLLALTENEIRKFEPIFPIESEAHDILRRSLWEPTEAQWERAQELKQQAVDHAANIERFFLQSSKQRHLKKSQGETVERVSFRKLDDALQQLFYAPEAPYRLGFVKIITDDGKLPMRANSSDSLFDAMLQNPMLRTTLHLNAVISLGYADVWGDNRLNVGVSRNRNDVPDIHLTLYVRDGDTILTADRKLRRAIRHVIRRRPVRLSTWKEMIGIDEIKDDRRRLHTTFPDLQS